MNTSTGPTSSFLSKDSGHNLTSTPEHAYDAISGSVSLLNDQLLSVRQRAAAYISSHARELSSLPPSLIERLVLEPNSAVVRAIIDSIPRVSCHAEIVVPILLHTLADTRPGVALTAARSLGALGITARSAFIPMQILSLAVGSESPDPRRSAFEKALTTQAREEYARCGEVLRAIIQCGFKELYSHLLDILRAPSHHDTNINVTPVVIGICLGSEKMRNRSLKIVRKHGQAMCNHHLAASAIEGALAFIAPEIERELTGNGAKTNFFHACCKTRPHSGLEYVISRLSVLSNENLELLRDYTGAYLSEGQVCESTVRRMCDALWIPELSTIRAAATNLGVLTDLFPRQIAIEVLDRIFEAIVLQANEPPELAASLVTAVSYISQYGQEILDRCANIISANLGRNVDATVAQILESVSFVIPDQERRALAMMRYLVRPE